MNNTLHKTFYKRFSLILIASAVIICALVIKAERFLLTHDLEDKGKSIAQVLSIVTLDAMLSHDYATMERYIETIARESFVRGIAVQRDDGEALAGFLPEDDGNLFLAGYPILLAGESHGVIRIAFSTARIDRITWQIVIGAIGVVAVLHIIGFMLVNMVLKQTIIHPLQILHGAILRVAEGNLDERVKASGPIEFRNIANSFNTMANKLRKSFSELEASRATLDLERRKLTAIVASMADGMFVTDNSETIISFNASATRITGYSEQEAIGGQCHSLFQSNLCEDSCALRHDGETMEHIETTLITKDGTLLPVAVSSAILLDRDGNRIGGVQTFRDITAEKERHEFYCRTQKLAAMGQMAAGVAHEINNPLANVIGYAKMVVSDADADTIARRVEVIIEQARKCSDIVRGLLDYSRASKTEITSVDVNSIIRNVIGVLQPHISGKGIHIDDHWAVLPPIMADERKVEQLLMNLMLNAVHAVQQGGTVRIKSNHDAEGIYFNIEDSGPGVSPELRNKIFDPFFTTKPVGEGTGLGLSICVGIIEELGGKIDLEDIADGASFKISIPTKRVAADK